MSALKGSLTICDLKAFPYWPTRGLKPQLLVRVETADGITGWGECGYTYREEAVSAMVSHLRDIVVGRSAFESGAIWQELYRRAYFEGCRVTSAAISGIDVALYDILGQALGVPVHQLLGGSQRDRIHCFASTQGSDVDSMLASGKDRISRGFQALRLHVIPDSRDGQQFDPWHAVLATSEAVRASRDTFGDDVFLGLDFHHRLTPGQTMSFLNRLRPADLDFLEEPIRAEDPEAYRRLRCVTAVPFAIGEEFTSKWAFRPFLESGLLDYARVDLANVGGFTEAMKIAGWCETHYINVMPHNPLGPVNTAATLHFAAAIPNLGLLEVRAHQIDDPFGVDAHIVTKQPTLDGNLFQIPTEPGLGIVIDETALSDESERYRRGHPPRFQAADGSYTNA